MYSFFALINRMKLIDRWSLMRNVRKENIQEHSHQTAVIAHALCVIANKRCGQNLNAERAGIIALYHDSTEIFTGDMPTPVKYFNDEIKKTYKIIENNWAENLLQMLPDDLQEEYSFIKEGEKEPEWIYVKAADTLCAYIKCLDEKSAGNKEFLEAEASIKTKLEKIKETMPALKIFMEEFLPPFEYSIDKSRI